MDEMTDDERFAAIRARDARFDGAFFTCVRSTGIFCRPSCPARTPARANVDFAPSAAAAVEAGFRACKRCGPSAPPGSPDEDPSGDLARRALRLIDGGALDDGSVPQLAARLAVSERTLHRALSARTGAGALAHARMRRARRAHDLVLETDLQLSRVAFAAGFGSERQLHDTFTTVFGHAPSTVRERSGQDATRSDGPADPAAEGAAHLRAGLAVRLPFDGDGLACWFAARAVPGVDEVVTDEDGAGTAPVRRTAVRLPHGPAVLEVALPSLAGTGTARLSATMHLADVRDYGAAVGLARRLLDLDADPLGIDEALPRSLPALAPLVAARPGVRLPGLPSLAEALMWAIVGQQITAAQARDQIARATDLAGEALPPSLHVGGVHRLGPTPAEAAARAADWYRGPGARRRALVTALTETPDADALDPVQLHDAVLALPGVGPWTAGYALLRGTRGSDLAPPRDVALLAAARDLGLAEDLDDLPESLAPAAPWRSYASLHLWHHAASLPPARRTRRTRSS
ncbi:helix-turn-helix domain-containing protein [Brachybacterium sp. MASK1Z-5]|uniref:Helix-turn-helix domain-containing protein n=1 Tax=Brachybacterium halotolerans TaxID=2795215 RepID=A0ABS1BC95_9MICO|nr:Ada metal-binding domain-containing protein [Brachybacterium halotolerans]MBK0332282.1 helix-turn-helix domain-containing protein [Brachybacterium halotolerans]